MRTLAILGIVGLFAPAPVRAQEPDLNTVRRLFVDAMPNDLDQYIRAEITKQLAGRLVIVLNKADADAVLTGTSAERTGTGAAITGRYLGLHDNATGSVSLVDRGETVVLWSSEAGDRSLLFGIAKRGGPRKVADRLVHDLKKALEAADKHTAANAR